MRAELADGRVLEFPDGTDPLVIQATVKKMLAPQEPQAVEAEQQQPQPPIQEAPTERRADIRTAPRPEDMIGTSIVEPIETIVTGAAAEPVAGLAGILTLPFADAEQAEKNIERVREAMTYIPRTEEGMQALQKVAEVLQPVGEAVEAVETGLGEAAFEATGSPAAAAAATTLPTAAITAVGLAPVRRAIATKTKQMKNIVTTDAAKKLLEQSAPTIEGLKEAARGVYKEIDNLNITINPRSVNRLSNELESIARQSGFNRKIHPKVAAVLEEFKAAKNAPKSLTEIDILRKVANSAARSIDPDEARIGSILVSKIDDNLDNLEKANFVNPQNVDVGAKYRDARQLWRRAKKSELLEESFEKAKNQASGFENGIRTQFRSILNNKKKLKGFTKEEISAMQQVVRGGTAENLAKAIGKFGFNEGQATNMLMGSLGVAGGAAVGGAGGAVAVPLIGQVSRMLAQKLTRKNAEAANLIARAGNNGTDVVKAYIRAIPKKERSPQELTELLMRPEISLVELKRKIPNLTKDERKLVADAVFFASALQSQKNQTQEQQ